MNKKRSSSKRPVKIASEDQSVEGPRAFTSFQHESALQPTGKQYRRPPDIDELARRGGLMGGALPYIVGLYKDQLFISASGYGTATVNFCLLGGLEKGVVDSCNFSWKFPDAGPEVVQEKIPALNWIPADEMKAFLEQKDVLDVKAAAKQLFERHLSGNVPQLQDYPPVEVPDDYARINKLQDEIKRLVKYAQSSRQQLREEDLKKQFPSFLLWADLDKITETSKRESVRYSLEVALSEWKRDDVFSLIGELTGISGPTAYDKYKKYRALLGIKRKKQHGQKRHLSGQ